MLKAIPLQELTGKLLPSTALQISIISRDNVAHSTGPSSPPPFFWGDGEAAQSCRQPKVLSYACTQYHAWAAVDTSHLTSNMTTSPRLPCSPAPAPPCSPLTHTQPLPHGLTSWHDLAHSHHHELPNDLGSGANAVLLSPSSLILLTLLSTGDVWGCKSFPEESWYKLTDRSLYLWCDDKTGSRLIHITSEKKKATLIFNMPYLP